MKLTIELPDEYVVASRGVERTLDIGKVAALATDLLLHGLTQKVADAASGAAKLVTDSTTVEDATGSLMDKAIESLYAGEWTRRGGGEGVSEETRVARSVVRKAVKAKFGAKSPLWATFTGLDDAAQNAKLDEWFAANAATFEKPVADEIAARKAAAADKMRLAKSATFAL